jgi:hemerythrin superfamily protein
MAKDAVQLLIDDHTQVKQLFAQIIDGDEEERQELFDQLNMALRAHSKIELEIFYPRAVEQKVGDEEWVEDAKEDHTMVEETLDELVELGVDDEEFIPRLTELRDAVVDHADNDEENDIFGRVKEKLSSTQLEEMGKEMLTRKNQLLRELKPTAK